MQSYRHYPLLTKDKKENCQKIQNVGFVFRNKRKPPFFFQIKIKYQIFPGTMLFMKFLVPDAIKNT